MRVTLIYNPAAGGGKQRLLRRLEKALTDRQVVVTTYHTRFPGDATRYLQGLEDQGDIVVAVGGDGTTNEVVNGLAPTTRLAVFATGTANVLVSELGLPTSPEQVAEMIVQGVDLPVHLGLLNKRRFVMMAGFGFDAWVVNQVDLALKKKIGKGAYLVAMCKALAGYGKHRYRLLVDGQEHECFSAIVANGRRYGGSFTLTKKVSLTQPSLQVLMLQRPSRSSLLLAMMALPLGAMERVPGVLSLAANQVQVFGPETEPVQCDGDDAGCLPAQIEAGSVATLMRVPAATEKNYPG